MISRVEQSPQYNIPNTNLGISRAVMPQISHLDYDDLKIFLKLKDISFKDVEIPSKKIKITQKDIVYKKIDKNIKGLKSESDIDRVLIISKDNYLVDGHHWFIAVNTKFPDSKISCIRVNVEINKLLDILNIYPNTTHKISEMKNLKQYIIEATEQKLSKLKANSKKVIGDYCSKDDIKSCKADIDKAKDEISFWKTIRVFVPKEKLDDFKKLIKEEKNIILNDIYNSDTLLEFERNIGSNEMYVLEMIEELGELITLADLNSPTYNLYSFVKSLGLDPQQQVLYRRFSDFKTLINEY